MPAGFSLVWLDGNSEVDVRAVSRRKLRSRLASASKSITGTAYIGGAGRLLSFLLHEAMGANDSRLCSVEDFPGENGGRDDGGNDFVDSTADETVEVRVGPVIIS